VKVLLVEDRGSRLYELKELLEMSGHKVYPCEDVYRARETWGKNIKGIDCIVVDLAMPPDGLDNATKSKNGNYTGWVFLEEKIFQDRPDFTKRCIIVSAWTESFIDHINETGLVIDIPEEHILTKNDPECDHHLLEVLKKIKPFDTEGSKL
jgi:CheY-like chemotaxis protein